MKKKIKYSTISQGHIIATWNILFLLSKYKKIFPNRIYSILTNSGKLGGSLPVEVGIRICIDYEFAYIDKGFLCLSKMSEEHLLSLCSTDDPNVPALRAILSHIISYHNFQWLIFYDSDPDIFREYLFNSDPEWVILLENAKLFSFEDTCVLKWWENVLAKYENYKEEIKKAIGDVGEKLTYLHEIHRIQTDGYHPAKSFVKWASQISDQYGYDVLSIKGKKFEGEEKEKIQIEVKSSDTLNIESFRFYISKPEWKTALKNINSYYFYCWSGIKLNEETALEGPFIIPARELVDHIPQDVSSLSEWSECRCVIDLSRYK